MTRTHLAKRAALCGCALAIAGCGGSSSMYAASPAAPSTAAAQSGPRVSVTIAILVPSHESTARGRKFVSPSTQSLSISVGGIATVVDVTPTTNGCSATAGGTQCFFAIDAPVGSDTFSAAEYDATNATGNILADGAVTATVAMGEANQVELMLDGVVSTVVMSVASQPAACKAATVPLTIAAEDADGNPITGTFANEVVLTDSNTTNAPLSASSFTKPVTGTTIGYTGTSPGFAAITAHSASATGATLGTFYFTPGPTVCDEYALTTSPAEPRQITNGSDGNVYFSEYQGHKVAYVAPTTSTLVPVGTVVEVPIAGTTACTLDANVTPDGIVTGPDSNIWLTDECDGIDTYNVGDPVAQSNYAITNGSNPEPISIVTLGSSMWFVDQGGNDVQNVSTAGAFGNHFIIPTPGSKPFGLVVGPDSNLWFTESLGNNIGVVSTSGTFHEYPLPTANANPTFITKGSDGALWFSEQGASQIGRITTAGVVTEYPLPTANAGPQGIVTGADGNIYFCEQNASKIGRFVLATGAITEMKTIASAAGPYGLDLGPDNNLWFTELTGNNVGYAAY